MRGCISGVFRRVDNAAPEAVGVQGVAMATANDLVKAVRHEDGSFLFSAAGPCPARLSMSQLTANTALRYRKNPAFSEKIKSVEILFAFS
jgi:hypothetical protein